MASTVTNSNPYSYLGYLQSLYSNTGSTNIDNSVSVPTAAVEDTVDISLSDFISSPQDDGGLVAQLINSNSENQLLGGLLGGSSSNNPMINAIIASAEAKITQNNIDLYNEIATGVSPGLSATQNLVASLGPSSASSGSSTGQVFDLIV